ncbi:MAG: hypothetical protein JW915_22490 [Chitinispirillaceae bacterium]|nr:hypothetical protein [Chitinispirillaceae bacterium]
MQFEHLSTALRDQDLRKNVFFQYLCSNYFCYYSGTKNRVSALSELVEGRAECENHLMFLTPLAGSTRFAL